MCYFPSESFAQYCTSASFHFSPHLTAKWKLCNRNEVIINPQRNKNQFLLKYKKSNISSLTDFLPRTCQSSNTHWSWTQSDLFIYFFKSAFKTAPYSMIFHFLLCWQTISRRCQRSSVMNLTQFKGCLKRHSVNDTSESFRGFCLPRCFAWWI